MTEDEKIKIKLEVCRDKTSGKLSIVAHFNSTAPNVFQDNDGYLWIPTVEEKEFISEAFEFLPAEAYPSPPRKTITEPEEIKEIKPTSEPEIKEEIKPTPETQSPKEENPMGLPLSEKTDKSSTFEETDKNTKTDDFVKEIEKKLEEPSDQTDKQDKEEPKIKESEKKEKDEGIIVEADPEAIDAALEKHIGKDKTLVEADEQTIIDKVLSQKRKGKWSRK